MINQMKGFADLIEADHAHHDANQKIKQHLDFEQTELKKCL